MIRKRGLNPDLADPSTRNSFFQYNDQADFTSMIELGQERLFKISFDNDIFNYTDRYFTNGIRFDLVTPALQANPLCRLMLPYRGRGVNYYGISLVQNMYTPTTTKTGGIPYGDRPYAAYMTLGSYKITNDPVKKVRLTSQIDLGIIGPGSYGEWVQKSFHTSVPTNHEPLGWEYQVQNDLILNYQLSYEKGVVNSRNTEITCIGTGNLGTLYTNLSGGMLVRSGIINPHFANLGIQTKKESKQRHLNKFQVFAYMKTEVKLVGYDATLQGGVLNKSSVYTIPSEDISRITAQGSLGISVSFNGIGAEIEQHLLSPEHKHGDWHKWGHIGLTFGF